MTMQPVELEIELFCKGLRLDTSCVLDEDGRRIARTRAGLGSGLELNLHTEGRPIWVNAPVLEAFAASSPLALHKEGARYTIHDERDGAEYSVSLPEEPEWYSRTTSSGTPMSRVGVLQGTYLGVYVSSSCLYWASGRACKFCTTGKNVGSVEEGRKRVQDVVEVAQAAREASGCIFTHLNTGYHYEDQSRLEAVHGLRQCEPFVRRLRNEVGGFVGVQAVPVPKTQYHEYDELISAGTDHFSFCYEFEDPEVFARICPGKAQTLGQRAFFDAMEYTSKKLGPGRVSGEIIAGLESTEATKRGIDRIVDAGAFPTVCIFRPTIGSELQDTPPPEPEAMKEVFAYLFTAVMKAGLPVGVLEGIQVSLVVQPEEASGLVPDSPKKKIYETKLALMKALARPYIWWKLRPRSRPAAKDQA